MKIVEKPELPKEITSATAAPQLLAQAVRVYLANQHQGTQSALTRAEVARTRKKFQKQKGSGNARHGDRKAPIFVGGGITFAPKPRDNSLSLSQNMRRKALNAILGLKNREKKLLIVSGLDRAVGKTSEIVKFLPKDSKNILIVTDQYRENIYRAARNIAGVTVLPRLQLNTYEVLKADQVFMMEEALNAPKVPRNEIQETNKDQIKNPKQPKNTPAKKTTTPKPKKTTKVKPKAVKKKK